jgi:membrane-bound lytic murein transglycosylase B
MSKLKAFVVFTTMTLAGNFLFANTMNSNTAPPSSNTSTDNAPVAPVISTQPLTQRSDIQQFIQEMSTEHGFDKNQLELWFSQANINQRVLELINKPFEAKPWYIYREHFVSQQRIKGGVAFWKAYKSQLTTISKKTGVAPEMIVAIIGVESYYGAERGKFSTFDSLTTLSFEFPRRAVFFKKELKEFLILCREQNWDPLTIYGSYAGAVGQPQFMPSSYRHYAVGFDGSKQSNLFNDENDVIASVANYFKVHGWQANQPIAVPAVIKGDNFKNLPAQEDDKGRAKKPFMTLTELAKYGVTASVQYPMNLQASLISVQLKDGVQYWLVFNNFYVITRYNTSNLYALAATQLAEQIKINYSKPQTQEKQKSVH